jgi:hypothetical protein
MQTPNLIHNIAIKSAMRRYEYNRAIITQWDGAREAVNVRQQGENVEIYYPAGVDRKESTNEHGETFTTLTNTFMKHEVALPYFMNVMAPVIIGPGAPDFNQRTEISSIYTRSNGF